MLFMYAFLMLLLLSLSNIYVIWLLMEMAFIFFLLFIMNIETKNIALVIYFFFQSFCSLLLFILIFYQLEDMVMITIIAKLGLFPFFYWLVVVSMKVSLTTNLFILVFQKLPSLWLFWLLVKSSYLFLYVIVYLNIFFVMINLMMISDLWLLLVYSSISNTSLLLLSVYSAYYFISIFIYLFMVSFIIFMLLKSNSPSEIMMVIFLFLTMPPFFLFFMKIMIISSLEYSLKLGMFMFFFDSLILLYYFSLIFTKFMISESNFLIYIMNLLLLLILMVFSNCVTLVIFY